jgi:nitrite reductase (NO-forming)
VTRPKRQVSHSVANAVSLAYLTAAGGWSLADGAADPSWLLVHMLLLGAVTNAIVTWSAHFAGTLLQQPPPLSERAAAVRLGALNAAVLGVLVGVRRGWPALTVASAALLAVVVLVHLGSLVRTARAGRTRRFAPAVRFHWVAAAALVLVVAAGVGLAVASLPALWYERVFLAHVHLGLLGWVALTVLGTEYTLWPTALRTRMVDGLERSARQCLLACAVGLALLVTGLLSWTRPLTVAGLLCYLAGVVVFLVPFVRTGLRRAPRSPATVMLAASTAWLVAGVIADTVAAARDADPYRLAADVSALAPWLLVGFAMQVLLGALSYLVPVVLGGPPAVGRVTAATVNRWGIARSAGLNAGALLLAFNTLPRVGWLLAAVAILACALLSVAAARQRWRVRKDGNRTGRQTRGATGT